MSDLISTGEGDTVQNEINKNPEPLTPTVKPTEKTINIDPNQSPEQNLANIAGVDLEELHNKPIPQVSQEIPKIDYDNFEVPRIPDPEIPEPTEKDIEQWAVASERVKAFIRKRKPDLILLSGRSSAITTRSLDMQNNLIEGIQTIIMNGKDNETFYKDRSSTWKRYDNPSLVGKIMRKILRNEPPETEDEKKARLLLADTIPPGTRHIMFLDDASSLGEKMRAVHRRLSKYGIRNIDLAVLTSESQDRVKNLFIGSTDRSFSSMLYELARVTSQATDRDTGEIMGNPNDVLLGEHLNEIFQRLGKKKQELSDTV